MKPIFLILLFSFCIFQSASAQNPLVKMWDKRYGGLNSDFITCMQQTFDGGFILGGHSYSGIGGDKTQANWDATGSTYDYWIVKIDSLGNKLWDKNFGGTSEDQLYSLTRCVDGGFILGGWSTSGISGDKSQPCWGINDYWIVKIDSLGNKQWDRDFGGLSNDLLYSVVQTSDRGYILGGTSLSGIGGDKSQANNGSTDYWIVKIDSLGNKEWDKDFGAYGIEYLRSALQTSDNKFILGGTSDSGIGGDKSQPGWGINDYWILLLDSLGNKIWDKDFGGNTNDNLYSLALAENKGYLLAGNSTSTIYGDKTQSTWGGSSDYDYWIVKIDSLGIKVWDKDFGGTNQEDEFGNVFMTSDAGFIIAGTSYSPISGNKTESNLGQEQTWIVKTDSIGNFTWDKTIFTDAHDENGLVLQARDGCFLVANSTSAGIAGYKSQAAWSINNDFWIVKFCDSIFLPPFASLSSLQTLCPGTCTEFLNLSFNSTSYQWNFPGAIPDTSTAINPTNICYPNPGSYDVTLIASNANGSDTLTLQNYITVFPHPPAQSITQSGDTLFAIAGSSSYQWYFNGNSISGATDYFYVATTSGDYNVVATDSNGCEVEAVINNVLAYAQAAVGSGSMQSIQVYPNPVTEFLFIRGLKNNMADEIEIFNVFGEQIFSGVNCKLSAQSDPSFGGRIANCQLFPAGLYYIEITSDKNIYRTKFIKQ